MSYFRSYFEKNNTIIKDAQVNTAKNPTTEIFYGSGFSKFIFKVDLSELKDRIDNGDLVINNDTKHYLNLTNTIFGSESFLGVQRSTGRQRTNSFDLILFKIPEFWDEGLGLDYEDQEFDFSIGNKTFDERPSNWFNRTSLNSWTINGIYSSEPEVITTIHFDNGNENINVDITDYINGILLDDYIDYGMGLAFDVYYQDQTVDIDQSVAFFTKYTQTFFEPFIESIFNDRVDDNRYNFVEKAEQNLYLYVTKGTNFYDLDELPVVDILDSNNNPISGLTELGTTKIRKGVYEVSFGLSGVTCDGKRFYYDNWKNIKIDGGTLNNIKQKFVPTPSTSKYTIGENVTDTKRYAIQFFGVKMNEKIKRGEKRKIVVNFRNIDSPRNIVLGEVYYRMFIKEGHTNVNIHDWTQLDSSNENSFFLDTSIYIPREYFLEIKAKTYGEEIFYKEHINFEILSEK